MLKFDADGLMRIRKAAGLSRTALHTAIVRLNLHDTHCRNMINRWERGLSDPIASDVCALAYVLNVPISNFFAEPEDCD